MPNLTNPNRMPWDRTPFEGLPHGHGHRPPVLFSVASDYDVMLATAVASINR